MPKIIIIYFIFMFSVCIAGNSTAQGLVPSISWQRSLGGSSWEYFKQMVTSTDGGMLILGTTTSDNGDVSGYHGQGPDDIWVVKLGSDGTLEWQRCLGGTGNDAPKSIILTPDGGCLVIGTTDSNNGDATGNHGGTDGFVAKLSSNGDYQWSKCLGGSLSDDLSFALVLSSGNYLVAGTTRSNNGDVIGNHGGGDIWLVELTTTGAIAWQRCYGGSSIETLNGITIIESLGYFIYGSTSSSNGDVTAVPLNGNDAWLLRINAAGTINWQKLISANYQNFSGDDDQALAVIHTGNDYIFVYSFLMKRILPQPGYANAYRPIYSTYGSILDINNGDLSFTTQLNPLSVYQQNDQTAWLNPRKIKEKPGGGLMIANNVLSCIMKDDYFFNFPPATPFAYMQSYNTNYLFPGDAIVQKPRCPEGYLPFITDHGYYTTYDVDAYNENICLYGGASNADNRPAAQQLGSLDGMINIGNEAPTYWGGSSSDYFASVKMTNTFGFFAGGETRSNDGHVSGNHGQNDIWIVKFSFVKNQIKGTVYLDLNNNNSKDAAEPYLDNQLVRSCKNADAVTSNTFNGNFINQLEDTGTYFTSLLINNTYYNVTPNVKTSVFTGVTHTDSFSMAVAPIPGNRDLQVSTYALTAATAGVGITYQLNYHNAGTDTIRNTKLIFIKDRRTTILSASNPAYIQNGDTLEWNNGSLFPLGRYNIQLRLRIDSSPVVNMYDTLLFSTTLYPVVEDKTPDDNIMITRTVIRSSFDSNNKLNQHAGLLGKGYLQKGGYIYYCISFQNTGTDTAFTVEVVDDLTADLEVNSFRMVEASHPYSVVIRNNKVSWMFNNIRLPDNHTNPEGSKGYLLFRIKPVYGALTVNKKIINKAGIYISSTNIIPTNTDTMLFVAINKPDLSGLRSQYCKNMLTATGKLLNPSLNENISIMLDSTHPVPFKAIDSSFAFNIADLNPDIFHEVKVRYSFPDRGEDSSLFNFRVFDFVVPVFQSPDTSVCEGVIVRLSSDRPVEWIINNYNVSNGVTNNYFDFNSIAGYAKDTNHVIILFSNANVCPNGYDTITVFVNKNIPPSILNSDTALCSSGASLELRANTNVAWSGPGVSGNQFDPVQAGPGMHVIIATRNNGACLPSRDTLLLTVYSAAEPKVRLLASAALIILPTDKIALTAINEAGGGTSPTYAFAKDRNFTNLLRPETGNNSFEIHPRLLFYGDNWIYVRLRTSESCYSSQTNTDSVLIKLAITTPDKNELDPLLKVYPNPGNGLFTFFISTGINDQVTVRVLDMTGRKIWEQDYGLVQQYDFNRKINIRVALKGIYVIVFRIGNRQVNRKIIIAK